MIAEGPGELRETIKPNGDQVWNGSRTIEDSMDSLESQIDDRQSIARFIDSGLAIVYYQYWLEYWPDDKNKPSGLARV